MQQSLFEDEMFDAETRSLLSKLQPEIAFLYRQDLFRRDLLLRLQSDSSELITDPCKGLENFETVPIWKLVCWYIGINSEHKASSFVLANKFANQLNCEAGKRLKLALKLYQECNRLWRTSEVRVVEFKRRGAEELGLDFYSESAQPKPILTAGAPTEAVCAAETPEQRQDRRLAYVRAAGADNDGEKMTGKRGVLAALGRSEKAAGRPMSDEKDVRLDLKSAVRREKDAISAGAKGSSIFNR